MIRKISIQDVVSKRTAKSRREDSESFSGGSSRRERDYLIEQLTRKRAPASIVESPSKTKKNRPKKNLFGKKLILSCSVVAFFLFAFLVLQFMVSATIVVKPKQSTVQVDVKLVASAEATTSPGAMTYQIITLSAVDNETVLATGTVATKPQKASGQITIFNSYSSAQQTLINNTRFETASGLVYRTPNTVKVPGFTTSGGKMVPGSITITVIADQVGSKYNIDMVDFTIPGFKADAGRYAKIFARSKTAMIGGLGSNSFGVSEADRQMAQTKIEARLKESLLRQAQSQKTANSIIFDTASKISFQHLADTAGSDSKHVVIHEQGTISSVVFDKKMLGKLLLSDAIAAVGNNAEVHGMESLHFIAAVSSTSPVWQAKPFAFTLTGTVDVVGVVDSNKLLQDIIRIPRSDLVKVLSNYPTIDKATATIKPFWRSSFPADTSKIKVQIVK